MAVSTDTFRETLSFLPGGVTVVTASTSEGEPAGLTATAVCSVSLRPPLVLVCVERTAGTRQAIRDSWAYAVNLLDEAQVDLARRFAGSSEEKFEGLEVVRRETGAPILRAAVAYCDCRVEEVVPAGDHEIYLGRVEAARVLRPEAQNPLVHYRGEYRALRDVLSTSPFGADEDGPAG